MSKEQHTADEKKMGVLGAASIGVGGMVGGGIFAVLGTAASLAGGGTPVAFAIAGAIALLTTYSYVVLSVNFPSAGGTLAFLDRAFGVNVFTGGLNITLWLSYLVTIALYASAFGSYALTFFSGLDGIWEHVFMSIAILIPTGINILNSDIISKTESFVVVLKLLLIGLVIVASASHVEPARIATSAWTDPLSVIVGGMVIFVAYEGFELIANATESVRDPAYTLPRAYYGCVLFVTILYIVIAVVTVGSVDQQTILEKKIMR